MATISEKLEKISLVFGVRHVQVILLFLCSTISYFIRINVSVAVVAMTNKNTTNPDFDEFDWNIQERSYILSSFFWGYAITQLPGGYIAQKYGAKYVLLLAVLIPSILSIITPISVKYGGWEIFCAIRVIQGFFQGSMFPAFHTFLSKWSPFEERNRFGVISHCGIEFGTILAFGASGFIAASNLGWPGISYISGGIGLLWSVAWFLLAANHPGESKSITLSERKYIEASLTQTNTTYKNEMPTPWLKILTSVPFHALIWTRIGYLWGFSTLITQIPTYMHNILKMDIQNNAIYSAIPYIVMLLVLFISMFIADYLSNKKLLSLSMIRKIYNTIATCIPGIGLIAIGFVGSVDNSILVVVLLIIVVGTQGCCTIGNILNHIDLSPNYSAILVGITNTFGTIVSIITPICVGIIVTDMENQFQWQIIFGISAAFMILTNLIYIIFGKMEPQPWNFEANENELKLRTSESQNSENPSENMIKHI